MVVGLHLPAGIDLPAADTVTGRRRFHGLFADDNCDFRSAPYASLHSMRTGYRKDCRIVCKLREVELRAMRDRIRVERLVAADGDAHVPALDIHRHFLRQRHVAAAGRHVVRTRILLNHGDDAVPLDGRKRLHVRDLRTGLTADERVVLRTHQEIRRAGI